MAEEELIRVVRKLVMVGPRGWVEETLSRCVVSPERPFRLVSASITEVSRIKTTEDGSRTIQEDLDVE